MDRAGRPEPGGRSAPLVDALGPLATEYEAWLESTARDPVRPGTGLAPDRERTRCSAARPDRSAGCVTPSALLPVDAEARRAFGFANRAMALQRRHTAPPACGTATELDYAEALAEVTGEDRRRNASWRPFQLAFVLLNLPALTDPAHPERPRPDATVDLLFFPTGGGKTEAYLGLAAYTFAIRRLQGVVGAGAEARDGGDGVAVLMRYTLRLLTAQQFQRAAALVCAAEVLRREDADDAGAPSRSGSGCGSAAAVSPNWYDDADEQLAEASEAGKGQRVNVLQTLRCPWCGDAAARAARPDADDVTRRVVLFCPAARAPTPARSPGRASAGGPAGPDRRRGDLPATPPAFVIATVDKFAQLPWRGFAGMLFGRVARALPAARLPPRRPRRRGPAAATGTTPRAGCPAVSSAAGGPAAAAGPDHPGRAAPDHRARSAPRSGCSRPPSTSCRSWEPPAGHAGPARRSSPRPRPPSGPASRCAALFGRELAIFPPQVLDVADTFFSAAGAGRRRSTRAGATSGSARTACGSSRPRSGSPRSCCSPGRPLFDTLRRAGRPVHDARRLLQRHPRAGRHAPLPRRRRHHPGPPPRPPQGPVRPASPATGMLEIAELTSRISSADITEALQAAGVPVRPELDTSRPVDAAIARRTRPRDGASGTRCRSGRPRDDGRSTWCWPPRCCRSASTSPGFGLMVVTGQPKNTAEYIQAVVRVGRDAGPARAGGHALQLGPPARPRPLRGLRALPRHLLPAGRGAVGHPVHPALAGPRHRRHAGRRPRNGTTPWSLNPGRRRQLDARRPDEVRRALRPDAGAGRARRRRAGARLPARSGSGAHRPVAELSRTGRTTRSATGESPRGCSTPACCTAPGSGRWDDLTVAMSMRETENEINLLLPPAPGRSSTAAYDAPPWR